MRPQVGLGLFSVRRAFEARPEDTLQRVADIGFAVVEPYSIGRFAPVLEKLLPAFGLTAPVAHAGPRGLPEEEFFAGAAAVGARTLVIPGSDPAIWATSDGIRRFTDELAQMAEYAASFGLRVAYHNHDLEARTLVEGRPALEHFAIGLPDTLDMEIDIYWLERGGVSSVDFLSRFADRVRFIHAKDASAGRDGALSSDPLAQKPVGEGILRWDAILSAAARVDAAIVEFDDYRGDVFDACATARKTMIDLISSSTTP